MASEATAPKFPFVEVHTGFRVAEDVSKQLFGLGSTGVERRDFGTLDKSGAGQQSVTLVAYFDSEEQARDALKELPPNLESRFDFLVGDDWRDAWKDHFKPTRIGSRFVVSPSWEEVNLLPNEQLISMDPGRAFGSGLHETTRLVLREVDRRVQPGDRILDVGCGSGILSIGALLLGAKSAHGTDIDEDAVAVAKENAVINKVEDRFTADTRRPNEFDEPFEIVLANIRTIVLVPLAEELMKTVAHGGTLILSGILREQQEDIESAYATLTHLSTTLDGEWVSLSFKKQ